MDSGRKLDAESSPPHGLGWYPHASWYLLKAYPCWIRPVKMASLVFLPCDRFLQPINKQVPARGRERNGWTARRNMSNPLLIERTDARVNALLINQPNGDRHVRGSPMGHDLVCSSVFPGAGDCFDMQSRARCCIDSTPFLLSHRQDACQHAWPSN